MTLARLAENGLSIGIEAPLDETFHEIAEHVLPLFHQPSEIVSAPAEALCQV